MPKSQAIQVKQFNFCFCTIRLGLVALSTKGFLCSGVAFVFGRCVCVKHFRKRLTIR